MTNFKYLKSLFLNCRNKKLQFCTIPYTYVTYHIVRVLCEESYLQNFTIVNILDKEYKLYILIEFKRYDLYTITYIINFNDKLKSSYKSYMDLRKLLRFRGLFVVSTSKGIMSLAKSVYLKCGGLLLFFIM